MTFTDVLGDKQFNIFAASVSQYRTMSFSYLNLSRRFQYALQGYSQTQFYYGYQPGLLYAYDYGYLDRDHAQATQTSRGGTAFGIYPLNRYARLELSAGLLQFKQGYNEPGLQQLADEYQQEIYGRTLFSDGTFMPLGVTFVRETTVFREYGPLAGDTIRARLRVRARARQLALAPDRRRRRALLHAARHQRRARASAPAASRAGASSPATSTSAATRSCAATSTSSSSATKAFFANAELRFPLIEAALTPIGVVGGLRGVVFFNSAAAGYEGLPMTVWTTKPTTYTPLLGYEQDPFSLTGLTPVFGPPIPVDGFRLVDGRASYGVGLETFALGFPIHFDWSWRTLFNQDWEDSSMRTGGGGGLSGSEWLRKAKFSLWIGYDF